jgi:3-phenylpropionate/trans-cinnamate dioxygenase ferredoxin subunit
MIAVAKSGEFPDGTMKEVAAGGHEMLIARVGDKYYATDNRCPHLGGKLSRGELVGTVVTCPRHGSQFDLVDGRVVRWLKGPGLVSSLGRAFKSPQSLATYNVQVVDDVIMIEV